MYTLKYPNHEVQASLNDSLLRRYSGDAAACEPHVLRCRRQHRVRNGNGSATSAVRSLSIA